MRIFEETVTKCLLVSYHPPFVYGATLTLLLKKCGGIRPIAVGNTIRRLVAKKASNRLQDNVREQLRPHQLGYGTRGGAEVTVHAVRNFLQTPSVWIAIVKLDFENAFDELDRQKLHEVCQQKLPGYAQYIR